MSQDQNNAIVARDLRKSYGDVDAVRGISLEVRSGEVFALLGPNGAGKTTTVEILEGHRKRSSGDVSVLGMDPGAGARALRERIGIVLQETGVEPYLSVAEAIELYRGYFPSPRPLDEIIDLVGLSEKRDTRVSKLSGGQKRRLDVAIGLAGDPELLFLDEPTTGFDPSARRQAWEMVRNLRSLGKTVFLTTHYMDEAQELADRVAVIAKGVIVAEGPPSSLAGRDTDEAIITFRAPAAKLTKALADLAKIDGGMVSMRTARPTQVLRDLTGWARRHHLELENLEVARPTLEDVYLRLVGDANHE